MSNATKTPTATTSVNRFNRETCEHETVELPIEVGDGASFGYGGDAYPLTVRRVSASGKTLWCSRDEFTATPGVNSYEEARKVGTFLTTDDPPESWTKFTKRQDGHFRRVGCKNYGTLALGRTYRQDPHF
jgi:hypothetical protein